MGQTIINISSPNDGLGDPLRSAFDKVNQMFTELYNSKVDKINGKGLSENDFTSVLLTKLQGIQAGAEVNIQSDLLQEDASFDDFVKNKDFFFSIERKPPLITTYSTTNTFTVPLGYIVDRVILVRTELWEGTEWSQTGNNITITKPMVSGNRIQINFY